MNRLRWICLCCCLAGVALQVPIAGQENASQPNPKWEVEGAGLLQNRKLKKQLDLISGGEKQYFSASDIEDAALVLISFLQNQGYLNARAEVFLLHADGHEERIDWSGGFDVFLPRDTSVSLARFSLSKGERFYYEALAVPEGTVLPVEEIRSFFFAESLAFQGPKSRVYTPSAMASSAGSLSRHLKMMGYRDAEVRAVETARDAESGAVRAAVDIEEGPHYFVEGIVVEVEGTTLEELDLSEYRGQSYSRFLTQDLLKKTRNAYYRKGFAEVAVRIDPEFPETSGAERGVSLTLKIESAEQFRIADLSFSGNEETRDSVMRKRITSEEGGLYNHLAVDQSRMALGRLGIFEEVRLQVEDAGENKKSVRFELEERQPWTVDMLLGWGSYERLRGGVIAERINIWGRAHRARFNGTVSVKSSLAELRYLMPELFKTSTAATARLYALNREEVSFDREEIGVNLGLSRQFDRFGVESTLLYTFESLKALNVAGEVDTGSLEDAKVGSIQLRLGRDERDSPLNPTDGNRAFMILETAARELGGEVDYQRLELGFSSHGDLGGGLYWHGGLTHGLIGSINGNEREVPTNKLFYPGGENSIRGYVSGEASPLALVDGSLVNVGARSFLLANLELEQFFNESLSLVLFADGLGSTRTLATYPFDETLVSVGLGVRFKTFMGPLRLEYGHNIRKREIDADGALHFSIGFPF